MLNLKVINEGILILKKCKEMQNLWHIKIMFRMFKVFKIKACVQVLAIVISLSLVQKCKVGRKLNLLSNRIQEI